MLLEIESRECVYLVESLTIKVDQKSAELRLAPSNVRKGGNKGKLVVARISNHSRSRPRKPATREAAAGSRSHGVGS